MALVSQYILLLNVDVIIYPYPKLNAVMADLLINGVLKFVFFRNYC